MPPKPKPLTPARRGARGAAIPAGFFKTAKRTAPAHVSGMLIGYRRQLAVLHREQRLDEPALPAAVSRWPMFDFTALNTHWPGVRGAFPEPRQARTRPQQRVPVAWHSIRSTICGVQPARRPVQGAQLAFGARRQGFVLSRWTARAADQREYRSPSRGIREALEHHVRLRRRSGHRPRSTASSARSRKRAQLRNPSACRGNGARHAVASIAPARCASNSS